MRESTGHRMGFYLFVIKINFMYTKLNSVRTKSFLSQKKNLLYRLVLWSSHQFCNDKIHFFCHNKTLFCQIGMFMLTYLRRNFTFVTRYRNKITKVNLRDKIEIVCKMLIKVASCDFVINFILWRQKWKFNISQFLCKLVYRILWKCKWILSSLFCKKASHWI